MRLTFRLALFLILGVAAVATGFAYRQVQSQRRELERDLRRQALDLAETRAKAVEPLLSQRSYPELQTLVDGIKDGHRLVGMAVYDTAGLPVAISSGLLKQLNGMPPAAAPDAWERPGSSRTTADFVRLGGVLMQVTAVPLGTGAAMLGTLAVFHEAAFIEQRAADTWRRTLASVGLQTVLILLITFLTIRWGLGVPLQRMAQWLQDLRMGGEGAAPPLPGEPVFEPLTREVSRLAIQFHGGARRGRRRSAPARFGRFALDHRPPARLRAGPSERQPPGRGLQPRTLRALPPTGRDRMSRCPPAAW